jgi:hypothetical protein
MPLLAVVYLVPLRIDEFTSDVFPFVVHEEVARRLVLIFVLKVFDPSLDLLC